MTDHPNGVGVLEPPASAPPKRPTLARRALKVLSHGAATALALAFVAGVVALGRHTGWSLPKFSELRGEAGPAKDDWCGEHGVPDSICVECNKGQLPPAKERGWCRRHGVHECPQCNPEVAQTPAVPTVTADDLARADAALAFAPRTENNSKCKLQQRRIQINDPAALDQLGIEVAQVRLGAVTEGVTAPAEIAYDPNRVARLSARVPGTVWRVERQIGDKVKRGELLALVDAAEVGRAKAELLQARSHLDLKRQTLAAQRDSAGGIPNRRIQESEAELDEAQVRLLTAEQALGNLGLPVPAAEVRSLAPAELAARIQFLGLPDALARALAATTASTNLLAVVAPFDGEVIARSAAAGERADPATPLFTVADPTRMWLTLHARLEDASKIRRGQAVRFRHAGHESGDEGKVVWVSPAADEKTRTVAVRVDLPNADGRHHANTFGTAQVVLRTEPKAVVVPSDAVHWEGDCNVVFVRDKDFETAKYKVFHVRKVRPAAQDVAATGPVTEIVAGLVPGEWVATANSGIFRSELLKNNLGAG
ncbi:MAG: efflux RND transporter periplasmic adaptor subunit [Gemmataceae bacterium]